MTKHEIRNIIDPGFQERADARKVKSIEKNKKTAKWVAREKLIELSLLAQSSTNVREFLTIARNSQYKPPILPTPSPFLKVKPLTKTIP